MLVRSERILGQTSLPIPSGAAQPVTQAIPADPQIAQPKSVAASPMPSEEKRNRLSELDLSQVKPCTKCALCRTRTNTVFGEGDVDAPIFFIGEGPGENEDLTGRPFVGRAGELLDKMIAGMGLRRDQVYIANIIKCRPPGNRPPMPDEISSCTPYLVQQLGIVTPRVIVTLGLPAAKYMLDDARLTMGRVRGQWQSWRGVRLMPTYHPAYILRQYTPEVRAAVWSDLKAVLVELGLPVPQARRADGA
jgi:DNA polymerase